MLICNVRLSSRTFQKTQPTHLTQSKPASKYSQMSGGFGAAFLIAWIYKVVLFAYS